MRRSSPVFVLLLALVAPAISLFVPAAPAFAQSGDVEVELDEFGVGGRFRPGEFAGMRVKLSARPDGPLDEATPAWVQWEVPNADGDIGEYGRAVTLTKRRPGLVWLYAPLPPETDGRTVWSVRVYEFRDGRRGRELGGLRLNPPAMGASDIASSMIGVVGRAPMGLDQLRLSQVGSSGLVFTDHEDTTIVTGLRPTDLPDRWEGLAALEVIGWSDALPQDLPTAQGEALRAWVRRGGHLVISLPEDTNPWGLGERGRHDLEDLLPTEPPRPAADVTLSTLLPILSKSRELGKGVRDVAIGARVFRDPRSGFDALGNGYEPLIALPDGRVLVVQRSFGHGHITLIGIDLTQLGSYPVGHGLSVRFPQADVFWNRILGRRADTPTQSELSELMRAERLTRGAPIELNVGTGGLFLQEINMSGRAGAGLLMAVLLFIAYWVVAGPGGFYALKHAGRVQHAWLAFAAAAGVFTALAWAGVNILRQNDVALRHVTFLDHVARPPGVAADGSEWGGNDPQLQRAVSWMSVYLPGYGRARVSIASDEAIDAVPAQRDLLVSWTPPREKAQVFPNADRYAVDLGRAPADFSIPSRSTATQLYARWLGGLSPAWGSMIAEDPDDPIRVETDRAGNEVLRGSIVNELPGPLRDVTFMWIWNRRAPMRQYARSGEDEMVWIEAARSGQMLNAGRMWRTTGIEAGATYPIPTPGSDAAIASNIYSRYVRPFEGTSFLTGPGGGLDVSRRRLFMEMLSIYHQLTPPKYMKLPGEQNPTTMTAKRMLAREADLSNWMNRPCLIVMGFLESECPVPVRVEGEPVPSDGVTMVRWIRPLPVALGP